MNTFKKIAAAVAAVAVASVSVVIAPLTASAEGKSEGPYTAWIATSIGTSQQWSAGQWEDTTATFSEGGTYTVSAKVPENGGSETIEFLSLETDINVYAFVAEGGDYKTEGTLKLVVDRIYVTHLDGTETDIAYNGPGDKAYCTRDDGSSARLNILNEWGGEVQETQDIDKNIPGGIGAGESINIEFTVSGIDAGGGTATDDGSSSNDNTGNNDNNGGSNNAGGNGNTTTAATNADGTPATTTTTAAGNSNNSNNNNNSNSSSNKNNTSASGNNATTSQTGDFGIAAVVLGAVATLALGAGAYTITKRKK